MDREVPKPGGPSAFATDISKRLSTAILENFDTPEAHGARRRFRSFPAYEAADLLGITEQQLRDLHADGTLPSPDEVRGAWRYYSAAEIAKMRDILGQVGLSAARIHPHRSSEDPLQIWQIMNLKGGTGKSTTTIHLAHFFALHGYRVLLVDLDPQGSITSMCGIPQGSEFVGPTIYDAIKYDDPVKMSDVLVATHIPGLALAPANLMLSEFEVESAAFSTPEEPFFDRIQSAIRQVGNDFDIVFVDSPPQFGFLTIAGVAASTSFLIPLTPSMMDLSSTAQFLELVGAYIPVIEKAGAKLTCDNFKLLITRNEPNDLPSQQVNQFLREFFAEDVMSATSLKSTVINDAMLSGTSLYEVVRAETTRTAYDRARDSMDGIGLEVERMVHRAWGRD